MSDGERDGWARGRARLPKSIAGVPVPDSQLAQAAADLAAGASPEFLYNHCIRTYAFSGLLLGKRGAAYDRELAFVASALHDLGFLDAFMSPTGRFEVDAADAARKFLRERDVPAERADIVWQAVALHSAVGIADRMAPEIAAVALGAMVDVAGLFLDELPADAVSAVVAEFPRLGFKTAVRDLIVEMCRKKPRAQVGQFTAEIGRRHIPGFTCPTLEDVVLGSPFAE